MAGDLEDFLRRAAQRRQAKVAQDRAGEQAGRQNAGGRGRPEYSDSKTERRVSTVHDEVLTAEVIEEAGSAVAPMTHLEEMRAAAAQNDPHAKKPKPRRAGATRKQLPSAVAKSEDPVEDLIRMLKQPGGIRQAILLREILERPEHRW